MIVSFLWKEVAVSLWEEWATLSVDADLVYCYQRGLALGFVIITTLCLLTPSTKELEDEVKKRSNTKQQESININNCGDANPLQETEAQMMQEQKLQRKAQKSEGQSACTKNQDAPAKNTVVTTPHQQLNFIIYVIIITVVLVILDRDYNGGIQFWLAHYFPREAALIRGRP